MYSVLIVAACCIASVALDWASYEQMRTILEVLAPRRFCPPYGQTSLARKAAIAGAGGLIAAWAITDEILICWVGIVLWLGAHVAIYASSRSRSPE